MSYNFNAEDMLDMAQQIERNGGNFYRKAAKHTADPDVKEILLDLASMEDDHLRVFIEMKENLPALEKTPPFFNPDENEMEYLKAMADGWVFDVKVAPEKHLTGAESTDKILKIAIGLEKDSIVFYLGMKKFVPESMGKERLDDIIQEEMKHIAILSSWIERLK